MNKTANAFSETETISQLISGINNTSHPIWAVGIGRRIGSEDNMTPEELIVGWSLVQMYGEQLPLDGDTSTEIPRKTLPERLASILLDLSFEQDGLIQDVAFQDLAIAVDTHRETAASVLRAFRRQGLVDFGHRRILIQDVAGLVEIAGEPDVCLV